MTLKLIIALAICSILCAIRGCYVTIKRQEYSVSLLNMYYMASVSCLLQGFIILVNNDTIKLVLVIINEMLTIFWFIIVAKFMFTYFDYYENYKKIRIYFYLICIVDFISLFINTHVYYYLRIGIVFLICIILILVTIHKVFKEKSYYRKQYLALLFEAICITAVSIIVTISNVDFDLTAFVFCFFAFQLDLFILTYIPQKLKFYLNNVIVERLSDGVLIFDTKNNCIYGNETVMKSYKRQRLQLKRNTYKSLFEKYKLNDKDYFSWNYELPIENKITYFNFQYSKIYDSKNYLIGSYILGHDRTEEVEKMLKEQWNLSHDMLTGLYTKDTFVLKCEEILAKSSDDYYIVYTDVKNFKLVNDFYGREIGDKILIEMGQTIKKEAKKYDDCICCRITGDNFVILVNEKDFNKLEIRKKLEKINSKLDNNMKMYTYFGVYRIDDKSMMISHMIDNAHFALNEVKKSYKNFIGFYNNDLKDNLYMEQQIISKFKSAIKNNEFHMYLQPQMSKEGKLLGAEALVRWIQDGKIISPKDFIPVFEKSGLISQLDKYIWEKACKALSTWEDESKYISINISIDDFHSMNVLKTLKTLINKYKIDHKRLKLEITESLFEEDQEYFVNEINVLRKEGFTVEMDDFGSGYSSLNLLKNINIDVIKMDMGFLYESSNEQKSKIILSSLIDLSKKIGLEVITEGVETKEQYDYLCDYGCDIFQGYYFSRPISKEDFENKYLGGKNEN